MPPTTIARLKDMGYHIDDTNPSVAARVEAILIHPDGRIEGDQEWSRGDGKAAGY